MTKGNPSMFTRLWRRFRNTIWLGCHVLFLVSVLAAYVPPTRCSPLALGAFLFLPLLVLHVGYLILFWRSSRPRSIVVLLLIIAAAPGIRSTINLAKPSEVSGIKLISWNVKNFNLYEWNTNKQTRQRMIRMIDSLDADVLCFQEFFTNGYEHDNLNAIKDLGYPFVAFFPAYDQKDGNKWGLAVFSKYPLSDAKHLPLHHRRNAMNTCLRVKLHAPQRDFMIYNAHLQSIHLDYEDYDYIHDIEQESSTFSLGRTRALVHKVLRAYTHRQKQVEQLLAYQQGENNPMILATDLNDIPSSYAYRQLSRHMVDAFVQRGFGISHTTDVVLPILRIDYIFASKDVKFTSYMRLENNLSDHHLLQVGFI